MARKVFDLLRIVAASRRKRRFRFQDHVSKFGGCSHYAMDDTCCFPLASKEALGRLELAGILRDGCDDDVIAEASVVEP